jgi:hypothetical protein
MRSMARMPVYSGCVILRRRSALIGSGLMGRWIVSGIGPLSSIGRAKPSTTRPSSRGPTAAVWVTSSHVTGSPGRMPVV